ncbi:MAG: tetraacyldisaccharide 4'-kinase [Deltaproteobacteria bacterium]|nr:tetraacyldisaccharide 4'-kinase [Deltaproteobacteria bacterium]
MTLSRHPLARRLSEAWFEAHPSLGEWALLQALAPASWVYSAAMRARSLAYENGLLEVVRAPIPVVSVGNLIVGGAGKTPVVIELARRLRDAGERVAVLTRGYGAEREDARLVADAEGIHLPAREAGDEPLLIARRCEGVIVLAGPDRAALAERAAKEHGATLALLDDGMQHRRLHRDLEIVVIDASSPLGNGRALPGGPLREPVTALSRANLVWLSRTDELGQRPLTTEAELQTLLSRLGLPVVRACYRPVAVSDLQGQDRREAGWLEGRAVHALSGVARPHSFLQTLTSAGARLTGNSVFGDHHAFSAEEIGAVLAEAKAEGAMVVTTEKDAQRLGGLALPPDHGIAVVVVETEILEGEQLLTRAIAGLPEPTA